MNVCPENCKLLLFTELQQALINKQVPENLAAKKLISRSGPESSKGKSFLFSLRFVGYPSYSRVVERSCKNKQEGAMVKHLWLENYQAAANSTTSLRAREIKAVTSSVKKEERAYSKGQSRWRNMMAPAWAQDISKVKKNLEEEANEFQSRTLL